MKKEDEPDFYVMDKGNPLPAVDDAPLPPGISTESVMMRSAMTGGMSPMRGGMGPDMMANREMMMMRGMSPMRGGGAADMMAGYKDPLLSRSMGGMGMGGMTPMSSMGGMSGGMMGGMSSMGGMGGMSAPMGGMSGMSGMSGMGGMGSMMGGMDTMSGMGMGGMPPMSSMAGMSSMGGMGMSGMAPMSSAFRESQAASAAGDMEFQRLRQIQQMHMLDRQMGSGPMGMSAGDPFDRMRNMEMRLGR
jgi:hypothetical protein